MLAELVFTCVIAVLTPQGEICVKPDGNVEMPAGVEITDASRKFWDELAKVYRVIKDEKCI